MTTLIHLHLSKLKGFYTLMSVIREILWRSMPQRVKFYGFGAIKKAIDLTNHRARVPVEGFLFGVMEIRSE